MSPRQSHKRKLKDVGEEPSVSCNAKKTRRKHRSVNPTRRPQVRRPRNVLYPRREVTPPDPTIVHGPLKAAPVMGVFRLSSSEKGKGRRNAPPFSPPPPASTRPPREPRPNEWYPQSHEQYPPQVIQLNEPDFNIEEDHDAPVFQTPTSTASTMDNAYTYQPQNALDHIQARRRQPEGCHPQPQPQESVVQRPQTTGSLHDAGASAVFAPIARPPPAELALFDTVWKVRTSTFPPPLRPLTPCTPGRLLCRFPPRGSY